MKPILHTLADRMRKRAEYRRTVAALREMPRRLAEDNGIFPGDEESIARTAVYGA